MNVATKEEFYKRLKASEAREEFSDVVEKIIIGNDRYMVTRYGKDKAALVSTDDALVIKHLVDNHSYDDILEQAKQLKKHPPSDMKDIA